MFLRCTRSAKCAERKVCRVQKCADAAAAASMKAKDRAKLEEMQKKYTVFYGMKDDEVTMIRPSGNPMTKKMGDDMLLMPDITVEFCKLVSIDSVRIFAGGLAAVATVTMHEKFTFKGWQRILLTSVTL